MLMLNNYKKLFWYDKYFYFLRIFLVGKNHPPFYLFLDFFIFCNNYEIKAILIFFKKLVLEKKITFILEILKDEFYKKKLQLRENF